jgi:hypothetical protein
MSARKAPNINNYFSSAQKELQLSEAEAEIQRLKAEIEELRAKGSTELELLSPHCGLNCNPKRVFCPFHSLK